MARAKTKSRPSASLEDLLKRGFEVALLLDTGHRVPLYAGEALADAARRAQREAPEAQTARIQAYLDREWTYAGPFPLEELTNPQRKS